VEPAIKFYETKRASGLFSLELFLDLIDINGFDYRLEVLILQVGPPFGSHRFIFAIFAF
jgi:hypothetical protein